MNGYSLNLDCSKPEDIARGLQAAIEQSNELGRELGAVYGVLVGLIASLGQCRHRPFVTHTEIEAAMLAVREAADGRWAGAGKLADSLLAVYRGEVSEPDVPQRSHLCLVPSSTADQSGDPMTK